MTEVRTQGERADDVVSGIVDRMLGRDPVFDLLVVLLIMGALYGSLALLRLASTCPRHSV